MNPDKSRKSFLVAIAAIVAAAAALPQLLSRGWARESRSRAPASAAKLKQDPRSVSREDSRFA